MHKSVETKKINLNSITVIPSSYENLVKGAISQNHDKFWQQPNERNLKLQNKSLEETYAFLENDQQLIALSRQIHLSESLETLSGISIPEKMRLFRGFLLNLEKVSLLFYLFKRIANIYNIETLLEASSTGLDIINQTSTELFGDSFPQEIIRPGYIKEGISEKTIPKTLGILNKQHKLVTTIRKTVLKSQTLNESLDNYSNLSKSEILKSGLTGPFARSVGIVTPLIKLSTSLNRVSSSRLSQFVTSQTSNPKNILEICNVELKLALERMIQLLPNIYGKIPVQECKLKNGSLSSSFALSLGINHLTVEIDEGRARYLKFVPFETSNLVGISKLMVINHPSLYHFILLFLNPEIELRNVSQ
ncbi:MAG: hypothetical protein KAT16_10165 [Candidatus Heimdallarchaeota archaeon]|nr:hypothetical protein [Candidatus Heimdallarchaeota archaeon]